MAGNAALQKAKRELRSPAVVHPNRTGKGVFGRVADEPRYDRRAFQPRYGAPFGKSMPFPEGFNEVIVPPVLGGMHGWKQVSPPREKGEK